MTHLRIHIVLVLEHRGSTRVHQSSQYWASQADSRSAMIIWWLLPGPSAMFLLGHPLFLLPQGFRGRTYLWWWLEALRACHLNPSLMPLRLHAYRFTRWTGMTNWIFMMFTNQAGWTRKNSSYYFGFDEGRKWGLCFPISCRNSTSQIRVLLSCFTH